MKKTTKGIKSILEDERIIEGLKKLNDSSPDYENQETTMREAYEGLLDIQNLLLESIDKGIFEEIPFARRKSILSQLQQIQRYYNNISQFIPQFNALSDQIQLTKLSRRVTEDLNIEIESKAITALRRKYKKIVSDLEQSSNVKEAIQKLKDESEDFLSQIEQNANKSSDFSKEIDEKKEEIENTQASIQEAEQEIENRKKEVLAFANNVDKSEVKIKKIETDLNDSIKNSITENSNKAALLIKQAEEALELKQTEGISKAYSSRLSNLTDANTKRNWLIGAVLFVLATLFVGFLLTGGKIGTLQFTATNNLAFIFGRILLTGIMISGAIFCANRYVYLKNLEEDYEYKVVLSKSILAFSNKIKDLDKDKVAEYLTKVLNELHQDPLRERKLNKKNNLDIDSLKQISEMLSNWKDVN